MIAEIQRQVKRFTGDYKSETPSREIIYQLLTKGSSNIIYQLTRQSGSMVQRNVTQHAQSSRTTNNWKQQEKMENKTAMDKHNKTHRIENQVIQQVKHRAEDNLVQGNAMGPKHEQEIRFYMQNINSISTQNLEEDFKQKLGFMTDRQADVIGWTETNIEWNHYPTAQKLYR